MSARPSRFKKPNLVSVTTINRDGSRFNLFPADSRGWFLTARRLFALLLLAIYVLLPWIPVNGHPAMFFDVANGRFHVFGLTFLTQDLWLLFFLLSGFGFALIYLTSMFGRLWCGWACPYTVFLEHVFRRIERWIEGDAQARRALAAAPLTASKFFKLTLKHGLFVLCSALIAHLFLSYFVSLPTLYGYMRESPLAHLEAFALVMGLTTVLYFSFAWFREQFCIILCPYGRIQSALTDDETLIIGYDEKRGEPRGHKRDTGAGDCIDCLRCVQVCPTGIDIRDGLQLECIGCAACVDACDEIMAKTGRPKGLVRYDSLTGFAGAKHRYLRPRTWVYTALMLLGASVLTYFLSQLKPVHIAVTRMGGNPYYLADGVVRNQYKIQYITKKNRETAFRVEIIDPPPGLNWTGRGEAITVPGQGEREVPLVVAVDQAQFQGKFEIQLEITAEPGGSVIRKNIEFLGPDPRFLKRTAPPAAATPPQ
jgi:cytochrome c oxidase accessory protein FixG